MPNTIAISLFRVHVERQARVDVDDSNLEAYRELEAAGLVMDSRPFAGDQKYALTRSGFERKGELLGCANPAG